MTQHFATQATALAFPVDGHFDLLQVMCLDFSFCNFRLPTLPTMPNIFSSFCMGALGLANLDNFLFFLLPSYLSLPLWLPRAQIKQLGSFLSLSTQSSVKLELFEQVLPFQSTACNLKHGEAQLELLDHPANQQWQFGLATLMVFVWGSFLLFFH